MPRLRQAARTKTSSSVSTVFTVNSGRWRAYQSSTNSNAGTREGAGRQGTITVTGTFSGGIPQGYV